MRQHDGQRTILKVSDAAHDVVQFKSTLGRVRHRELEEILARHRCCCALRESDVAVVHWVEGSREHGDARASSGSAREQRWHAAR